MIRSAWAYLWACLTTFVCGSCVLVLAALGVRGGIHARITQKWAAGLLWGSNSHVRVHGIERVDWTRPHVLVANHVASFEILAIAATVPASYHFVAKKELERIPFFGRAWKAAGHISIDRANRQKAVESLRLAAEIINRDGSIVIIFPEGTRSLDGELQPFKKGAFQLALEARVPIIPTIVTGSERILGGGSLRIRPGTMDLYFGDPIPVDGHGEARIDDLISVVHGRMEEMLDAGVVQSSVISRSAE
jgi:1-acyl-sn-glycerol-3-phosphate acyltransferase